MAFGGCPREDRRFVMPAQQLLRQPQRVVTYAADSRVEVGGNDRESLVG